ncbi:hypothetical protein CPT_Sansa110 [Caulobacter phage Sansa]|uniref:Uncharacterized protein n=1 Tax=Caulobacter phage Sansa TaxID=1675600 RepID=A0A0K1LM31_9CAUD|nr:hypothetical protein HOR07_gp110 [Caulobacter phage Sansa]AKU43514.1 hypothetical protein CPT_Sansa110 [Caulobacter phage Sansa]
MAKRTITRARAVQIATGWASYIRATDPGRWLYAFSSTGGVIASENHRAAVLEYVSDCIDRLATRRIGLEGRTAHELQQLRRYLAAAPIEPTMEKAA